VTHNDPRTVHDGGPSLRLRTAIKHAYLQMHQRHRRLPAEYGHSRAQLAYLPVGYGCETGVWLSERTAATRHTSYQANAYFEKQQHHRRALRQPAECVRSSGV
jgi:hypothetical protein